MYYLNKIILVFIVLLVTSCSTLNKAPKKAADLQLSKNLSRICLSGEGRGRMTGSKQKIYFNFEAINNSKKKEWALAFAIPLYGEEILRIDWSNPMSFKARGKIVKRLYMNMGKNKALMMQSFKTIVAFLNIHSQSDTTVCHQNCDFYGHKLRITKSTENELIVTIRKKEPGAPELRVKAFDFDKYYKRLELNLYGTELLLSLSLFYSSCASLRSDAVVIK